MKLTEAQETFLELKWGKDYTSKLVEAWHTDGGAHFSMLEKAIVFEWFYKFAGIKKDV